ncbi:hypothetical protein [Hyphobacterium sp.]|uniref:hypothetical protein n=1 Tax=Hyphobacterium sp. TaxID=2004662 RepID=UPI003BADBCAA
METVLIVIGSLIAVFVAYQLLKTVIGAFAPLKLRAASAIIHFLKAYGYTSEGLGEAALDEFADHVVNMARGGKVMRRYSNLAEGVMVSAEDCVILIHHTIQKLRGNPHFEDWYDDGWAYEVLKRNKSMLLPQHES